MEVERSLDLHALFLGSPVSLYFDTCMIPTRRR